MAPANQRYAADYLIQQARKTLHYHQIISEQRQSHINTMTVVEPIRKTTFESIFFITHLWTYNQYFTTAFQSLNHLIMIQFASLLVSFFFWNALWEFLSLSLSVLAYLAVIEIFNSQKFRSSWDVALHGHERLPSFWFLQASSMCPRYGGFSNSKGRQKLLHQTPLIGKKWCPCHVGSP